jgi:sugar/nucleoside kinase (ribokinase family)
MKSIGVVGLSLIDTIVSTLREIPLPGGKTSTFIDSIITRPGGGAANMVQNLALLDIPVQLFTKIGMDTEGDFLLKTFSETGIDTSSVKKDPVHPTSHTIVCVHDGGERTFLCCTPICASFGIKDIDKDALFSHSYLFYQDFFSFPELDTGSAVDLLKEAKEHNIVTFLDECQGYLGVRKDIWENMLPYIDYLLPSVADLALIYPDKMPEELCRIFHALGAKNIIIKQGKKNTVFFDGISIKEMSPLNRKVIDTTGAGDAFDSGFTWGILNNLSLQDSISIGHIVAAECITNLGASIPRNRQTELLDALQTHKNHGMSMT